MCLEILHDCELTPMYCVFVGAAGELMHSEGTSVSRRERAHPSNMKLVYDPRAGFNEGFLSVSVCTHHKRGLGAGCELLLDL